MYVSVDLLKSFRPFWLVTGAAMEDLEDRNLPISQVAMCYAMLFIVNGIVMICLGLKLQAKWYLYIVIALVDTAASYVSVHALQYTSVTSMGILSCTGVIVSIPLVYFAFEARFHLLHYIGVGLAIAGIVLLVLSDKSADSAGRHAIWGDVLLILGSCLYTVNSVVIEKTLKRNVPFSELLCMMSGFSFVFSCVAFVAAGEYKQLIPPSSRVGLLRLGAILAQFVVYSLVPFIVKWSGSTILQLSFLSTAVWAVPIRLLWLGGFGSEWWIFLISAVLTVSGVLLYVGGGNVYRESRDKSLKEEHSSESNVDLGPSSQQIVAL